MSRILLTVFAGFVLLTGSCGGEVAIFINIPAASSPDITLVRFVPTSALLNEGSGSVTSSVAIDFFDNDADVSSLTVSVVDSHGFLVSRTETSFPGLTGISRGTIPFALDFNTSIIESYTFTAFVTDRFGNMSNPVFGTFRVLS